MVVDAARAARAVPALLIAVGVVAVCTANGGFFPTEWGWAALGGLLVCVAAVLVRDEFDLGVLDVVLVCAFAAYVGWTALSTSWSVSSAQPVLEVERLLVYLGAVAGLLLVTRRRDAAAVGLGVLVAVTGMSAYALATRLVPDHVGTFSSYPYYLLAAPVGYSNALGLLAAMGIVLALGVVTHAPATWARAAAGGAVALLALTWYFTFSRGATGALVLGVVVAFAFDPRRLRLSVACALLAPAAAVELLLASRSHALTHRGAALHDAAHEGHRLLLVVVAAIVVDAALAAALSPAREISPRIRRAYVAALGVVAVALVAGALVHVGNPITFVSRATDAFRQTPQASENLNSRLFTLSNDNRSAYWNVAWREYTANPLLGGGAGSYVRYWDRDRPLPYGVRNAHNQYLETLAELGPVGLVLLVLALAAPLVGLVRARREPLVAAIGAAYVGFLAVLAIDWDWQLTGVSLAGIACGVALVVAARRPRVWVPGTAPRAAIAVTAVALAVFALVGQLGNNALGGSRRALGHRDYVSAARQARRARRWAPWSYQPWQLLGEAQLGLRDRPGARRSLERALAKDRQDWSVWFDLAVAGPTAAARHRAYVHAARLNRYALGPPRSNG